VALILIPTIVGVLLAGIQLADAIGTSSEYRRLTQVAELVQRVGVLSHELGKERTLTAWYVADNRRPGRMTRSMPPSSACSTPRPPSTPPTPRGCAARSRT
jgi:hypothetical protein